MNYAAMEKQLHDECKRLAELAFRMYGQNINRQLYLVGILGANWWEALSISEDWGEQDWRDENNKPLEGCWRLVLPEHINRGHTIEQMQDRIYRELRREPLWIFAEN